MRRQAIARWRFAKMTFLDSIIIVLSPEQLCPKLWSQHFLRQLVIPVNIVMRSCDLFETFWKYFFNLSLKIVTTLVFVFFLEIFYLRSPAFWEPVETLLNACESYVTAVSVVKEMLWPLTNFSRSDSTLVSRKMLRQFEDCFPAAL